MEAAVQRRSVWSYSKRPVFCSIAGDACWMFLKRILLFVCLNKTGNLLKTLLQFWMMNNLYSTYHNFKQHTCAATPLNKRARGKWGQSTAVSQYHSGTVIDIDHTGLGKSHFGFLLLLNVYNQTHRQQLQEVPARSIKYTALGMICKAEAQANEPTMKPKAPARFLNPKVLPTPLPTALCLKGSLCFHTVWFSSNSRGKQTARILLFPHVTAFQPFAMNPLRGPLLAPQQHGLGANASSPSSRFLSFCKPTCTSDWNMLPVELLYFFTEANYRSKRNLNVSKMPD